MILPKLGKIFFSTIVCIYQIGRNKSRCRICDDYANTDCVKKIIFRGRITEKTYMAVQYLDSASWGLQELLVLQDQTLEAEFP